MRVPKPAKHGRDHCPGGEDPIPAACLGGGATSAALLTDLNFDGGGDDLIPNNDWTRVTPGDGSRFFEEGWIADGNWNVFFDGDSNFSRTDEGLYVAHASVEFTSIPNGSTVGVAIQYAASSGFFYPDTRVVVDGEARAVVTAPWYGELVDIRLWCYQASGGAFSIGPVEFHVRLFESLATGEFVSRP